MDAHERTLPTTEELHIIAGAGAGVWYTPAPRRSGAERCVHRCAERGRCVEPGRCAEPAP
jgi:hypothetical protein